MLFQTLRVEKDSKEWIKHLELDANKVAAEYNDKKGNLSIVKVATEIETR